MSGPGFNMYSEPVKSIALVFAVNCNWHCAVGIGGGFQHIYVGGGWNDRFAGLCETLTQRIPRSCAGIACGMEVGCRIRSAGMVGARLMTLPATTFSPQPKTWQVPVGVSFAEARSSTLWIRILAVATPLDFESTAVAWDMATLTTHWRTPNHSLKFEKKLQYFPYFRIVSLSEVTQFDQVSNSFLWFPGSYSPTWRQHGAGIVRCCGVLQVFWMEHTMW